MSKNRDPRSHHYVPQFYQKGFCDADNRLWMYDRKTGKASKVSPKTVCCENELYTVYLKEGRDRRIEATYLSLIDGHGATAIRSFAKRENPSLEIVTALSQFMAHQITRTPAFREVITSMYKHTGEELLRIGFAKVERVRHLLETYSKETGDRIDPGEAESIVEATTSGEIRVATTEMPFLKNMLELAESLAEYIESCEWEVLVAPDANGYITCDYPFVVLPPEQSDPGALFGFGVPHTVKYFPLTRNLCLRMGDRDFGFRYTNIDGATVRRINQNLAVNSERFIMCPSLEQLQSVIERSGTAEVDTILRSTVEVVRRDEDSSLQKTDFWPRRKFFYPAR